MNVGVLGSGGREHALAWKLAQSARAKSVFVLPGNGGTSPNVAVCPTDAEAVAAACERLSLDLLVVGGEEPLAAGVVDRLATTSTLAFGPTAAAARVESSKLWAKRFMERHGIPCAEHAEVATTAEVEAAANRWGGRLVVKADGLAAGKGVVVCDSPARAQEAWHEMRRSRPADEPVFVEEPLDGWEVSVLCVTDGRAYAVLPPAQDHKAVYDGDRGPNTGGMGAFAPVPALGAEALGVVRRTILEPTLAGLRSEGIKYCGFLYLGLMVTDEGPKVLEYNARLGDPEAEAVLPLLRGDLLDAMHACCEGTWDGMGISAGDGFAVDVVLASGGYPGAFTAGREIVGLESVDPDVLVFHGATRRDGDRLLTSGGRVLHVVARADSLDEAIDRAYRNVDRIRFAGMHARRDIGRRL
ncbi:MAG: phosphoribosylamine--glycine ligase [Candidatus Bipolaricaulota bacterium]|nr:phosphoribosylamine--glycine ligase [Candidatus Bipolaricaulota bacterium]